VDRTLIELETVLFDVGLLHVEPLTARDPELQWQPVRDIDQVLVLQVTSGDVAD
jgi:hypothetical protein